MLTPTLFSYCYVHVSGNIICRSYFMCTVHFRSLHLNRGWSMKDPKGQIFKLADMQNLMFSSICGARPHWRKLFMSHPPHIVGEQGHMLPAHCPDWHERQMVHWGENEEFLHMHTWHMNKVWSFTRILHWGFSEKKDHFGRRSLWLRLPLGFRREQTKGF